MREGQGFVLLKTFKQIADAIREVAHTKIKYMPSEMADAIRKIVTEVDGVFCNIWIVDKTTYGLKVIQTEHQKLTAMFKSRCGYGAKGTTSVLTVKASVEADDGYVPGEMVIALDEDAHDYTVTTTPAVQADSSGGGSYTNMWQDGWEMYSDSGYSTKTEATGRINVAGMKSVGFHYDGKGTNQLNDNDKLTAYKNNNFVSFVSDDEGKYSYFDNQSKILSGDKNLDSVSLPNIVYANGQVLINDEKLTDIDLRNLYIFEGSNFLCKTGVVNLNLPRLAFLGTQWVTTSYSDDYGIRLYPSDSDFWLYRYDSIPDGFSVQILEYLCENASLETLNVPNLQFIYRGRFMRKCTKIKKLLFPKLEIIDAESFENCSALETIDFGALRYIGNNCYKPSKAVIFRGDRVVKYDSEISPFNGATIYVPDNLLADYKADDFWGKNTTVKALSEYKEE